MNLVHWTPNNSRLFPSMDNDLDQLMNWAFGGSKGSPGNGSPTATPSFSPALDFVEEKDRYRIQVDLPGLKKEDIEMNFQDGILTIRGQRIVTREETAEEGNAKAGRVIRRERHVGSFERKIRLPEKVNASAIEATFENGVLNLEIPFLPEAQPVRLEIK